MNLEILAWEEDLLDEELAVNDKCLELQVLVFRLAKDFPAACAICEHITGPSIISAALAGILQKAFREKVAQIRIALSEEASSRLRAESVPASSINLDGCDVFYLNREGWIRVGVLPLTQAEALRGILRRIEAVGYADYRSNPSAGEPLPDALQITWESGDVVLLILSASGRHF